MTEPISGWQSHSTACPKILIVDDGRIKMLLGETMNLWAGYDSLFASDSLEALLKLSQHPIDVILTVDDTPRADGFALVRSLRARGSQIPIVLISASFHTHGLPSDILVEVAAALPITSSAQEIHFAVRRVLDAQACTPPAGRSKETFDPAFGF